MRIQKVLLAGVAVAVLGLAAGRAAWAQKENQPPKDEPQAEAKANPEARPTSPKRDGAPAHDWRSGAAGSQRGQHWRDGSGERRPPRDGENGASEGVRGPMPGGPYFGGRFFGPPNWDEMAKRDPEMTKLMRQEMELDGQARELAEKCRKAQGAEQEELKAKLKETLVKQFENRQQRRQLELERLEKELARLRSSLEARKGASERIINHRLEELLGHGDEMNF